MIRSRALRKLRRNRLGTAAAVVIAVYLAIAVAVGLGFITLADTTERVGPMWVPGLGLSQDAEKRLENADFWVRPIERALARQDPEEALAEIHFGQRRPADVPPEEMQRRVARAEALLAELSKSENLDQEPALLPELEELERAVDALYVPLEGWSAFRRGLELMWGTDRQGRSISLRAIYAIKVAVQIGVVTGLLAVLFGSLLGAAAAYFGGAVDHLVIWLYSTLSSIPYLVLLGLLVFVFTGTRHENTLIPLYAAFAMTFWIGPCRVVRGEALRIKELDYVQAANALGQRRLVILTRHILPNVSHLILINFSLLFIGAIKAEVILTFLNLGVKNEPSWGTMIAQSSAEVVNEFFWQIGAATFAMFGLVLAFNIFTDALQDALDPKHLG